MKIGVVGASGYAGGELLRLLSNHDSFELAYISAGSNASEEITTIHQQLLNFSGRKFEKTDIESINKCDLVFLALPHGESASLIANVSPRVKIVDLGADFRLADATSWADYYGGEYAGQFTYGLAEINGNTERISKSEKVANPGCYATAIILGSAPAIASKSIFAPAGGTAIPICLLTLSLLPSKTKLSGKVCSLARSRLVSALFSSQWYTWVPPPPEPVIV